MDYRYATCLSEMARCEAAQAARRRAGPDGAERSNKPRTCRWGAFAEAARPVECVTGTRAECWILAWWARGVAYR